MVQGWAFAGFLPSKSGILAMTDVVRMAKIQKKARPYCRAIVWTAIIMTALACIIRRTPALLLRPFLEMWKGVYTLGIAFGKSTSRRI